jgi:hypothetical protein
MLGMYAHRMKHLGQLLKAPLLIVFVAYIGLICGSLLATWKYGIVTSYIGFAWLVPLAGIIWAKGYFAFGFTTSSFGDPFCLTAIVLSLFALLCLPVIVAIYWHELSVIWRICLVAAGLSHGLPFEVLLYFYIFGAK